MFVAAQPKARAGGEEGKYACEAYARIVERVPQLRDRSVLAAEYASKVRVSDERVEPAEIGDILATACATRNGWKVILARYAPEKPSASIPDPC